MKEEHGNFERLVVGHVLGDLPDADASRFRSHLLGCRDCRARVAELRGIAADLADAERDELARAQLRTEAPRRVDRDASVPDTRPGQRISIRHVTIAAIVVIAIAAAMGFWNLHLRATSANYFAVAEARGDTLDVLASGVPLEVELTSGIDGIVAAADGRIALNLTGVPTSSARDELLVAWFLGGEDGTEPVALGRTSQLDEDGLLATTVDDPGADEMVVTRESDPGDEPSGPVVVRAALRADAQTPQP